jgi:Skp family chaperone for outer membrane proteins
MLKSRLLLVLAFCILSCLPCFAASAEEKSILIGVVDSKEILEKYSRAKAVLVEIAKEEAALSKKFQEKRTQLEAARKLISKKMNKIGKIWICKNPNLPVTAKSTWFVARVNSRPITLQICTSIFGP